MAGAHTGDSENCETGSASHHQHVSPAQTSLHTDIWRHSGAETEMCIVSKDVFPLSPVCPAFLEE